MKELSLEGIGYLYFLITFVCLFLAYIVSVFSYYLVHKKVKFKGFRFSLRNYYIMMAPFLVPSFLLIFLKNDLTYVFAFVLFSIAGILGEILFSHLWKIYFRKPFWRYSVCVMANKFSSWLNFIPWGVGGFLFLLLAKEYYNLTGWDVIDGMSEVELMLILSKLVLLFIFQFLFFKTAKKIFKNLDNSKGKEDLMIKYFYFVLPFFLIGFLFYDNYYHYLSLFFIFGVFGFIAEYIFGKVSKIVIGRKLWTYEYLTIDKNHTTPLNIIPFGLTGYFFVFIFLGLKILLNTI